MADTTTDTTKGPGWAYKDDVVVEGVLIGFPFTKESVTAAANFTFDPEDILLASYPKVGEFTLYSCGPMQTSLNAGADTGFPEGGGGVKTFTNTPPPPWTLST